MSEVITTKNIIKKVPEILSSFPTILKGIKVANDTDETKPVGLGVCFEEAVQGNSAGLALLYEGREYSYQAMNEWVNQLSHYMLSVGITKGDAVAILIENRPELLVSVLACAKIGAISAMVNTSQRSKVLVHSISLVEPKMVITGEECREAYDDIRQEVSVADDQHLYFADADTRSLKSEAPKGWLNAPDCIESCSISNPDTTFDVRAQDPCFYVYTSGTTGLPKAVVFNHGRFMKAYGAFGLAAVRLQPEDRMYVPLPFYHSTAMVVCWGSVLAGHAGLVMARKFSASRFWQDIRDSGSTSFGYVGELCRYLLEQPVSPLDIQNKVHVIVGNGMRPSIWDDFKSRYGIERVMEFYASSEGNIGFTNLLNFDKTVGISPYPYAIVEYDKETDMPVLDKKGYMKKINKGGVGLLIGEITEKTPFHGYTDANKTQSCILENVFKPGDRWFNTGDLMRDMGYRHAQFVDRTGDTFRWKGENVSTTEVEMMLEELDEIQEAIVYGVEIPNTNGRAGMASVKLACDIQDINFEALLTKLKTLLPKYAIPVFLTISSEVEVTGTFKHLKGPLKENAYDLSKNDHPVYVWLPEGVGYDRLTPELQADIDSGVYRY
jgi:citronellyl-CoA synthetase